MLYGKGEISFAILIHIIGPEQSIWDLVDVLSDLIPCQEHQHTAQ
jgi:hypothetical protein